MKKIKRFLTVGCTLLAVTLSIPHSYVEAEEVSNTTLINSSSYTLDGEQFEVQTWRNSDGTTIHTVPTEVKNKAAVAEFVDNLITEEEPPVQSEQITTEEESTIMAAPVRWQRSLTGSAPNQKDARISWSTSGYSDDAILLPITADEFAVNTGTLRTDWYGTGNADKIVLTYSYTFKGTSLSISYPPALTKSSNTVSWTSLPVSGTWYLSTTSESASAQTRTISYGADISAGSDIYKGSNIYRPKVNDTIGFMMS